MSILDGKGFCAEDWKEEAKQEGYDKERRAERTPHSVPTGRYQGEIIYLNSKATKRGGEMVPMGFKITEGKYKGEVVFSNLQTVVPGALKEKKKDGDGNVIMENGEAVMVSNGSLRMQNATKDFMTSVAGALGEKYFNKKSVTGKEFVLYLTISAGQNEDFPINVNFRQAYKLGEKSLRDGDENQVQAIRDSFKEGTVSEDGEQNF